MSPKLNSQKSLPIPLCFSLFLDNLAQFMRTASNQLIKPILVHAFIPLYLPVITTVFSSPYLEPLAVVLVVHHTGML